jgi:hypothetical protein
LDRVLVIREEGSMTPADLAGGIYLDLADRSNAPAVFDGLKRFTDDRF